MRLKGLVLILCFVFSVTQAAAYERERELILPAAGIEGIEFDCGAGDLRIQGKEGLKEIKVQASIVVIGEKRNKLDATIKKRVRLSLTRRGSKAVLTSKIKGFVFKLFRRRTLLVHLDVTLPQQLFLDIEDRSGLVKIDNYSGDIKMEDGSGHIEIATVTGNLRIVDGSGSIKINNVDGDVETSDGSGSMDLKKINGNVTIADGSGNVYIDGVEKNVNLRRGGSGKEYIKNVKGKINK